MDIQCCFNDEIDDEDELGGMNEMDQPLKPSEVRVIPFSIVDKSPL
jgi:hypothetical protein